MTRSTSLNYLQRTGISVAPELFASGGAALFSAPSGGTLVDDAANAFSPNTSAISMVNTVSTNNAAHASVVAVDTSAFDTISVAVYVDKQSTNNVIGTGTYQVILWLGSTAANLSFYSFTSLLAEGWSLITLNKTDFTLGAGTGVDWASVDYVQLQTKDTGAAISANIKWGGIFAGTRQRPIVCISFDDQEGTQQTNAFPKMDSLGLKGSLFCNSSQVGSGANLTLANLTSRYALGWDVLNHSAVHANDMVADPSGWKANLATGQAWMIANGFIRGSDFMAPPGGQYTDAGTDECRQLGYNWIRGVQKGFTNYALGNDVCKYNIPTFNHDNTVSLATSKAHIDSIISLGVAGGVYFHIVDTVAGVRTWATADFNALMDYIYLKQQLGLLDVLTYSELTKLYFPRYSV